MKKIFLSLVCLISTANLFAQNSEFIPYITSYVQVDTLVSPDIINLKIMLQSDKAAGKKGMESAKATLYNILKSENVDLDKNIKTVNFTSDYNKKGNDVNVYHTYSVVINNVDQLAGIINKGAQNGISNIKIESMESSKASEIERILVKKALIKAKEEAEFQVSVYGQKISKAIMIDKGYTNSTDNVNMVMYSRANSESANVDVMPEIEFKNIKISLSMNVKFGLY